MGAIVNDALDVAVRHRNATGGVEGRKIEVLLRDAGAEVDNGPRLYSELVEQPDVIGVLWAGALGFDQVIPRIREDGLPVVAVFEDPFSDDQVAPRGQVRSLFQMQLPEAFRHQALAAYAADDRGYTSAGLLYDADLDPDGRTRRLFEQAYDEAGIEVIGVETFSTDDTDFTSQLQRLQAASPQLLYLDGLPVSAAAIVTALEAQGAAYVDTPTTKGPQWHPHIAGSPGALDPSEWTTSAGQAAKVGTLTTGHVGGLTYLPSYSIGSWLREFLGKAPIGGEELAADALASLIEGMKRAGSNDRGRIVEGIESIGATTFASAQFGYAPDRHLAFTPDDAVILTLERLRGPAPTDPAYELGAEWGPEGAFSNAAAQFSQLVRPTIEANRRVLPEVMDTVMDQGYGTQCTTQADGTLSNACKIH